MEASRLAWRELVLPVSREAGIAWFQNSWSLRPGLHWAMIPIYCLNSITVLWSLCCILERGLGGWPLSIVNLEAISIRERPPCV